MSVLKEKKTNMNIFDFLAHNEELKQKPHPCVQCGYCCKVAPCQYGRWDVDAHQCKLLTEDNPCSIYEKIKFDQASPAMGCGCCSSMNSTRAEKMEMRKKDEGI